MRKETIICDICKTEFVEDIDKNIYASSLTIRGPFASQTWSWSDVCVDCKSKVVNYIVNELKAHLRSS